MYAQVAMWLVMMMVLVVVVVMVAAVVVVVVVVVVVMVVVVEVMTKGNCWTKGNLYLMFCTRMASKAVESQ